MRTNPYEPVETNLVSKVQSTAGLNWLALTMAIVIFILLGIIMGTGLLIYLAWEALAASSQSHLGYGGHVTSLLSVLVVEVVKYTPSAMGALYLGLHINMRPKEHAVMYVIGVMLISGAPLYLYGFWIYGPPRIARESIESIAQAIALYGIVCGIAKLRKVPYRPRPQRRWIEDEDGCEYESPGD